MGELSRNQPELFYENALNDKEEVISKPNSPYNQLNGNDVHFKEVVEERNMVCSFRRCLGKLHHWVSLFVIADMHS